MLSSMFGVGPPVWSLIFTGDVEVRTGFAGGVAFVAFLSPQTTGVTTYE